MGSRSKDASSRLHEKHQAILANMLKDEDNKFCADCHAKGPRWASWNIGVFMCIRCAGIHRNLGVHISRVKSVNLDSWTPEQIETIQKGGNGRAREIYEANLPANFRRPQDDYAVEQFIRAKYERKLYLRKDGSTVPEKKTTSSKQAASKRDTSADRASKSNKVMSVPRPVSGRRSASPQPMKTSPSATSKSKSQNLLDLDAGPSTSKPKPPTQQTDWLTGQTKSSSCSNIPNLMDTEPQKAVPNKRPSFGFDPGFVSSQQASASASLIPDPGVKSKPPGGTDVKNSIMSLYSTPQYNSYTPQGYPVNAYYYQQQQQAAMRMAHLAQQQAAQVNQVQQQMAQIKLHQPPQPIITGNPSAPANASGFGAGGQTLSPHLW